MSLKLYFPLLSALVLAATSMPLARLMRITSSPAAGLLVVPLVTVPVRVWAADVRATEKTISRMTDFASLVCIGVLEWLYTVLLIVRGALDGRVEASGRKVGLEACI